MRHCMEVSLHCPVCNILIHPTDPFIHIRYVILIQTIISSTQIFIAWNIPTSIEHKAYLHIHNENYCQQLWYFPHFLLLHFIPTVGQLTDKILFVWIWIVRGDNFSFNKIPYCTLLILYLYSSITKMSYCRLFCYFPVILKPKQFHFIVTIKIAFP